MTIDLQIANFTTLYIVVGAVGRTGYLWNSEVESPRPESSTMERATQKEVGKPREKQHAVLLPFDKAALEDLAVSKTEMPPSASTASPQSFLFPPPPPSVDLLPVRDHNPESTNRLEVPKWFLV